MPSLLSGARRSAPTTKLSPTRYTYITLAQVQAALGATPTTNTGYTLVVDANGVATFTNSLGQIAFSTGSITSNAPGGNLVLNPSGTGTITLNGPVNIPDGIIGNGFKKEIRVATTQSITVSQSTTTVIIDGIHVDYLDRVLVRSQPNPVENGIYYVITATFNTGTTVTNAITLVRSSDANSTKQVAHAAVPVTSGITYPGTLFFTSFRNTDVLDTDPVQWLEIIDDLSFQNVFNKTLNNAPIGQITPREGLFTDLTASNFTVLTAFTATSAVTFKSSALFSAQDANVLLQPSGTGTVIINPSGVGSIDNMVIGVNNPRSGLFTNLQATTQIYDQSPTNSTSTDTGALVVVGGVGIGKDLTIGGNLSLNNAGGQAAGGISAGSITTTNLTVFGQSIFTTSTNSTSTTTGALVIAGGVGIAQDLFLGGNLYFAGEGNRLRVQSLAVTTTTNSTSTTTGAAVVTGGLGIGGDVWIGGQLHFAGNGGDLSVSTLAVTSTTNSTSTTTGAIVVKGGVGIAQDLVLGGSLVFSSAQGTITAQQVHIIGTATSVSTTTGALVVDGGIGVGRDMVVGGNLDLGGQLTFNKSFTATFVSIHITSTASDTSIFENNALYIEGGTSVKKDLSVYGNTLINGNLTVMGTQTTVDSQNTYIIDPVIDIGTGINNSPLSTNDGYDRGLLLHYNTGFTSATDNHAFLGRDASTGFLTYKTNIYPGGYETFAPNFTNTGSFGTAQFGGLRLLGGTTSVSTNTGDLQVLGGMGVLGNSFLAGRITLSNTGANTTQTLNHALMLTAGGIGVAGDSYYAGVLRVGNATASSNPTSGAFQVQGGVGINANLSVGGPVQIYAGTSATSTGSGALIVGGGIGANGDIYCHKIFTDAGETQLTNFNGGTITGIFHVNNNTTATSTGNAAFTVLGGVGIGANLIVGGSISGGILYSGGAQVLTTATPTGFDGGVIHYPLQIGDPGAFLNTTAITLNATVESYNTQSGAMVSYGGVGIGKSVHIGGTLSREGDWSTYNWAGSGIAFNLPSATYYDNSGIGTYTSVFATFIDTPTFDSKLTTRYTTAATVYVGGAPIQGSSNVRFDNAYSLYVNDGTVYVGTTATSTATQTGNAVQVQGGVGVAGDVLVGGTVKALQVYDNSTRVISTVNITAGTGLSGGGTVTGPTAVLTLTNAGVLSNTAGAGIAVNNTTGNVTITNTGVLSAVAGTGVNINNTTGNIVISNVGVTSIIGAGSISVSTSTGSVTISSLDTLQDVTARGATTNRPITLSSTGTALTVLRDASVGGSLTVGSSATVGTLFAGTSTLGSVTVNGTALITGNLTVQGAQTIINSTQVSIEDPVIDLGTNVNNTPLTTDDGFDKGLLIHYNTGASTAEDNHAFIGMEHSSRKLVFRTNIYPGGYENVPNPYSNTGSIGGAILSDLHLVGGVAGSSIGTGDLVVDGGISVAGNSTLGGQIKVTNTANTISTQTGAVQVAGGLGVSKDLFIGGSLIVNGFIISTSSQFNGGTIYRDLVINSPTASTGTNSGALVVQGGGGIGGDLYIGGRIDASAIYQNGQPISTNIGLNLGPGLTGGVTTSSGGVLISLTNTGLLNLSAGVGIRIDNTGSSGVSTITNIGVTGITVGTGIGAIGYVAGASTSTGTVRLVNLGVTSATAGTGINIDQSTGSITVTNVGVTSITKVGNGLTISTSTGSVFLVNSGVTSLTAGTDTAISQTTGDIIVWNNSTLDTVVGRGNATTGTIVINNATTSTNATQGALVVQGGVGIGQNLVVGGNSTVIGSLTAPFATIADFTFTASSITSLPNDAITLASPGNAGSVTLQANAVSINATSTATITAPAINAVGIVNFTNTTTATSTTTGAVKIAGGISVGNNLFVQGTITANGGYLGLNPEKIFMSTSSVTVVDRGVPVQQVYISVAGTTSTQFFKDSVSVNVPLTAPNISSTGTITRSGTVTRGAWGQNGAGLAVLDATYNDTNSQGVVGLAHVNVFGQPTVAATSGIATTYNDVATMYIKNAPVAGNINTNILRPWALYVNNGKVYIGDNTASVNPQTGALQVAGGVGISGDLNVDGNADFNGSVLNVGNSEIYTYTSPTLSSNAQVGLDSFAISGYQSAKYFVQVVDNTVAGQPNKMYVTELIVFHDGLSSVYISEYGMASNTGDLGTFDATISGPNVTLTFTPNYTPTSMVVKVHRTTLSR